MKSINCAQISEPGCGKTESLNTIAEFARVTKRPFAIVDTDGKAMNNQGIRKNVDLGLFNVINPGSRLVPGNFKSRIKQIQQAPSSEPKGWLGIGDALDELEQNPTLYCGACLDTLTVAEEHIKKYISFTNRKANFEFAEWSVLLLSFQELFNFFYSLPLPLKIINMHCQYDKDEHTGRVKLLPLITGSFKDKAGSYPSEFYFNFARPGSDKSKPPEYRWRVTPDERFVARSDIFKGQVDVPQNWEPVWRTLL